MVQHSKSGQGVRPTGRKNYFEKFRIATWNVGTLCGKAGEIVETLTRRCVDICCLQETRWKGGSARLVEGNDSIFKIFWVGCSTGSGGVGIAVHKKWIENVSEVNHVSERIIMLKLAFEGNILCVLSCYAPQSRLTVEEKTKFYDDPLAISARIGGNCVLFPCGDFNGHIGTNAAGYDGVHGGYGFGDRNIDGERLLEFVESLDLVICNSLFKKRKSHLVTYSSGGAQTQIDYILTRLKDHKLLKDVKVVPSEECVNQHRLVIWFPVIRFPKKAEKVFTPKVRLWKLKDNEVKQTFEKHVAENAVSLSNSQNVEDIWNSLKSNLLESAKNVCGMTKKGNWRKETWWWEDSVENAIKEKRFKWKSWKKGKIIKEEYLKAKRHAKSVVYKAKKSAEDERFAVIKQNDKNIFKMANQIRKDNKDIIGDTCIKDKNDNLCFTNAAKRQAWKDYYQNLLNTEFPWSEDDLPPIDAVLGPPPLITKEETVAAIRSMKDGKAPGPSGIVSEMLKASLETSGEVITSLANVIIREERIPSEWNDSYILSLFKGKGSASALGNYRGLKLTDHVLKVLEQTVEKHIREIISVDEMQFGFMPGVGTTDAIFIMRQLQEKYLAKRRNLYLAFVDLEKAFDCVPRKVIWWAMRVVKIPEWIITLAKAMYIMLEAGLEWIVNIAMCFQSMLVHIRVQY